MAAKLCRVGAKGALDGVVALGLLRLHPRGLTLEQPDAMRRGRAGEEGLPRERKAKMQRGGLRGVVYLRRHCSLRRRKDLVRRWHPLPSDSLQSPDAIVFSR
jgi:hypothetical protein